MDPHLHLPGSGYDLGYRFLDGDIVVDAGLKKHADTFLLGFSVCKLLLDALCYFLDGLGGRDQGAQVVGVQFHGNFCDTADLFPVLVLFDESEQMGGLGEVWDSLEEFDHKPIQLGLRFECLHQVRELSGCGEDVKIGGRVLLGVHLVCSATEHSL